MADFSIELAAARILDGRSKAYFKEVVSGYVNENYRSAIVMLWAVVVADLLFKLDTLSTLHGDATATSILSDIDSIRAANPNSPDWERKLVEKIAERTHLFDIGEDKLLKDIQDLRHLCAHPILKDQSDALFTPTREQVRAHIRTALEAVLCKPAVMSQKVFDSLLDDLEEKSSLLPDDVALGRFLESKYLTGMPVPTLKRIFRSLWRVCFKVKSDARAETNREINYRSLVIMTRKLPEHGKSTVAEEQSYYSEIAVDGTPPAYLFGFLTQFPDLYDSLTPATKTLIQKMADADIEMFGSGFFLSASASDHITELLKRAESGSTDMGSRLFGHVIDISKDNGLLADLIAFSIKKYAASGSFDRADVRFSRYIRPLLEDMSAVQLEKLVVEASTNYQTYGRGGATTDHQLVRDRIAKVTGKPFDSAKYPDF